MKTRRLLHSGGPFPFLSLSTFSRSSSQAGYETGPTASTIRVRPSTSSKNVRPRITGPTRGYLSYSLSLSHTSVASDSPCPASLFICLSIYSPPYLCLPRTDDEGISTDTRYRTFRKRETLRSSGIVTRWGILQN